MRLPRYTPRGDRRPPRGRRGAQSIHSGKEAQRMLLASPDCALSHLTRGGCLLESTVPKLWQAPVLQLRNLSSSSLPPLIASPRHSRGIASCVFRCPEETPFSHCLL